MSRMIEVAPEIRIKVLERKLASAEASEARVVGEYVDLVRRNNRLAADRQRAHQQNMELLARMDALAGYPQRLLLGA